MSEVEITHEGGDMKFTLRMLVALWLLHGAGQAVADDASQGKLDGLLVTIGDRVKDAQLHSGTDNIDAAVEATQEVERLFVQLEKELGSAEAKRVVYRQLNWVRELRLSLKALREMRAVQSPAEDLAGECNALTKSLEDRVRAHVEASTQDASARSALLNEAEQASVQIKARMDQAAEPGRQLDGLRFAAKSFVQSEGAWALITSHVHLSADRIYADWHEQQVAMRSACQRLTLGTIVADTLAAPAGPGPAAPPVAQTQGPNSAASPGTNGGMAARPPVVASPREIYFLLRMLAEGGGDDLAMIEFTDGSSESLTAGGGFTFAAGAIYLASSTPLAVEATAGFKINSIEGETSRGSTVGFGFNRASLEVLASYHADHHRFGGGVTAHLASSFRCSGIVGCSKTTADSAVGGVIQYAYSNSGPLVMWDVGVRVTFIEYTFPGGTVDGTSIGLLASVGF